jgi:hypothetical protein
VKKVHGLRLKAKKLKAKSKIKYHVVREKNKQIAYQVSACTMIGTITEIDRRRSQNFQSGSGTGSGTSIWRGSLTSGRL